MQETGKTIKYDIQSFKLNPRKLEKWYREKAQELETELKTKHTTGNQVEQKWERIRTNIQTGLQT